MSENIIFREVHSRDAVYLKRFWKDIFDCSDSLLGAFFEFYVDIRLCVLAQSETQMAAMGFLFPIGSLKQPGKPDVTCALAYAIATAPEYRRLGIGTEVVRRLREKAEKHGFGAVVLRPNDDELFEFYEKSGMHTAFYHEETQLEAVNLPRNRSQLLPVTAEGYEKRREELLAGLPHVAFDRRALQFQSRLLGDGGLFFIDNGCAAVDFTDGRLTVRELLGTDTSVLGAVAARFGASKLTVCTHGGSRFAMANLPIERGYMGFAFD